MGDQLAQDPGSKEDLVFVVSPGEYPVACATTRESLREYPVPGELVFDTLREARRVARSLRQRWVRNAYPEKALARRISKPDRRALYTEWEASGRECGICGDVVVAGQLTHIDHVRPVADGGTRDRANLRVTHQRCNATRYYREWRERTS
jgi:5-methylcytosine-specific restriction endonuclease McrA